MKVYGRVLMYVCFCALNTVCAQNISCIRINQLGYATTGSKVAVYGSEKIAPSKTFSIRDEKNVVVFTAAVGNDFGKYGPFNHTYRLDFSNFKKTGKYILMADEVSSPAIIINDNAYDGAADFCLRYMRQQRSGFNPFLKDSCHVYDGYTLYAPVPDSTHIDVVGGWHDASDYLQYAATSANAIWHLLAAYRDFPGVFNDEKLANGLPIVLFFAATVIFGHVE